MLTSLFRLRKDRQIRQVLDQGRLLRGQNLLVRLLPLSKINPPFEKGGPCFAAIISKKREKRAVLRNRMKRQLREIFKKHRELIGDKSACVFIARKCSRNISYQELEQDFLDMLKKVNE